MTWKGNGTNVTHHDVPMNQEESDVLSAGGWLKLRDPTQYGSFDVGETPIEYVPRYEGGMSAIQAQAANPRDIEDHESFKRSILNSTNGTVFVIQPVPPGH